MNDSLTQMISVRFSTCYHPLRGLEKSSPLHECFIHGVPFSQRDRIEYMNTSRCHNCYREGQREILLVVFTRFCRFSRGAYFRISSEYFDS